MQRVNKTVIDENGNGVNGATVTVIDSVTLLPLANVYNSGGSLTSPAIKTNPFTTDSVGRWSIALPDGRYNYQYSGSSFAGYTDTNEAVFDSTVTYPSPALGTVTQVAVTVPAELAIAGTPITGTGTFAFTWASITGTAAQGKFIGSPSGGGAGALTSRVIALTDLPAFGPTASTTFGSTTKASVVTTNAQGIITGITESTVTPAWASVTSPPTTVDGFGITDGIKCIWSQTADVTIGNTSTATTIFGTGAGNLTLAGNRLKAGTTIRIKALGYLTQAIAAQTLRLIFGASGTLVDTTALTIPQLTSLASSPFILEVTATVRTVGGIGVAVTYGQLSLSVPGVAIGTNYNAYMWPEPAETASRSLISTVAADTITCTLQWGTAAAASTFTITNLQVFLEGV